MNAAAMPAAIWLFGGPAMTLGRPGDVGSSRRARMPLALNSSGWLSVVPRKCVPAIVPPLPAVCQKLEALTPPRVRALTLLKAGPLPGNAPENWLAGLFSVRRFG